MKNLISLTLALLMSAAASFAQTNTPLPANGVEDLIQPYLQIQKHLADDDLQGAQAGAHALLEALTKTAPARSDSQRGAALSKAVRAIQHSGDLQSARVAFREASQTLMAWVEQEGGSEGKTLYVVHCPMAFDNEGASWLQADKTVSNPYYGASMLRCGSIQKPIEGSSSQAAHHHP